MPLLGPRPDNAQVLPNIYNPASNSINVANIAGQLVPTEFDALNLTYWTSGNGIGQIQTVQYYLNGLSGTLMATLTLNYNSSGQISTVVKS